MLIWAAIPFYICAVVATAAAASVSAPPYPRRDRTAWLALSALFGFMIVLRLVDGENLVRDTLRQVLSSEDLYERRRAVQAPILFLATLVIAMLAAGVVRRSPRPWKGPSRWVSLGCVAGLAYVCVLVARIVSLHQIDRLLYNGPHMNRILDPALALFVAWTALRFRRDLKAR